MGQDRDSPSGDQSSSVPSRLEAVNESMEERVTVPSGLQLFSAYRKGLLDPESISTQPQQESKKAQTPAAATANPLGPVATAPKIPTAWLKSGSTFGKLVNAKPPTSVSPVATAAPTAQKVSYEPQAVGSNSKQSNLGEGQSLLVSPRQRGNPLLEMVRNVAWEYADIEPDYLFSPSQCAFFLSLRYHNLNPEYIFSRLQSLKTTFQLVVLIVLVDVEDAHHPLKELNKFGLTQNGTVVLAWSSLEAARYLETFKASVKKAPDDLIPDGGGNRSKKDLLALATDFFTSLRAVSRSDAAALLAQFKTVGNIMKADAKSLENCPGIGPVKVCCWYSSITPVQADKIYAALHSGFKRKGIN